MTVDDSIQRLTDALAGERADWHHVEVRPYDLTLALIALVAARRAPAVTETADRCSRCGVPIAEHPLTDACALAEESAVTETADLRAAVIERADALYRRLSSSVNHAPMKDDIEALGDALAALAGSTDTEE